MFYKKGIDITNDKSMFNFLVEHFTYDTMNSWNGLKSIANNVKVYNLKLDGDCWVALDYLRYDDYAEVNNIIYSWEREHKGYEVGFNGRSGGYLVLYGEKNASNILPDYIADNDYEHYKQYCIDYYGSVKAARTDLVAYTKLVQDFDKLCDEIRDVVNDASKIDFNTYVLENAIDLFNIDFEDDLLACNFNFLELKDKKVYIGEIKALKSLLKQLTDVLEREANTYGLTVKSEDDFLWLESL